MQDSSCIGPINAAVPRFLEKHFDEKTNFDLERFQNGDRIITLYKTSRQLPRALQPKSARDVQKMFENKAKSHPTSPVTKIHPLFQRNQSLTPDVSKVERINCREMSSADPSLSKLYRNPRVIQESICPLLREALGKDDSNYVLENFLLRMKEKTSNQQSGGSNAPKSNFNSNQGGSINYKKKELQCDDNEQYSDCGEHFTVRLVKRDGKSFGLVLGTTYRNGNKVICADKLPGDYEARKSLQEGDEINGH